MPRLSVQVDKSIFINYDTTGFPQDMKDFLKGFLEWMAQKVIDRIDEVIRRQLYNWHPLSESYKNWKKVMDLDPKIWIASGQTKNAITYWYSGLADGWFIGVHPRTLHRKYIRGGIDPSRKTKARLIDIIRWMEEGTTKMKARPLFVPVLKEFKPKRVQTALYQQYLKEQKARIR